MNSESEPSSPCKFLTEEEPLEINVKRKSGQTSIEPPLKMTPKLKVINFQNRISSKENKNDPQLFGQFPQRTEQRRLREARAQIVQADDSELLRHHKQNLRNSMIWSSTLLFGFLTAVGICYWKQDISIPDDCRTFLHATLLLQSIQISIQYICFKKINEANMKLVRALQFIIWIAQILLGIWGYILTQSDEVKKQQESYTAVYMHKRFLRIIRVMQYMVYIRLGNAIIQFAAILVLFCYMIYMYFVGPKFKSRQQQKRLPKVLKFLKSKSRNYDPKIIDRNLVDCAICMEDFTPKGKHIVTLNCNKNHTFHEKCMKNWVEKNDICPMCREPILKK